MLSLIHICEATVVAGAQRHLAQDAIGRIERAARGDAFGQFAFGEITRLPILALVGTPVSYTHLDVYKRQVQGRSRPPLAL